MRTQYIIIGIGAFITILLMLAFLYSRFETESRLIGEQHTAALETAYRATTNMYRLSIEAYYEKYIENDAVISILRRAKNASEDESIILRELLYRELSPAYEELEADGLRQLHFHTVDSRSFLRFHLPDIWNDPLADIRPSVRRANEEKIIVSGFEGGRAYPGFRYVIPILDEDEHLGSVELSLPFDAIQKELELLLPRENHNLILREYVAHDIIFPELRENFTISGIHSDFYSENPAISRASEDFASSEITPIVNPVLASSQKVQRKLLEGESFSHPILRGNGYIASFATVHDTSGNHAGYVMAYAEEPSILKLRDNLIFQAFLGILMVIFTSLAFTTMIHYYEVLKKEKNRLNTIANTMSDGLYVLDNEGKAMFVNQSAADMIRTDRSNLEGKVIHDLVHNHRENDHMPLDCCPIFLKTRMGENFSGEETFITFNGKSFPVELNSRPLIEDGSIRGSVTVFHDISVRKQSEADLRIAAAAFDTQEGILITDAQQKIIRVNQAFTTVTGYSPEEAIGKTPAMLKSGRHEPSFYRQMYEDLLAYGFWQGEIWNRRKDGTVYPEWLTITAIHDEEGRISNYVANFTDISERKDIEARIHNLAFYDPLTQLPNRRLLFDRLSQAIASCNRSSRHGALMVLDLDNFKYVNEIRGHEVGDELLIEVSLRLQGCIAEGNTVARLGGDEFVILLTDLDPISERAAQEAELVAEHIREVIARPFSLMPSPDEDEHPMYHCSFSIGISIFQRVSEGTKELLRRADVAMYQAKADGRNGIRFFDPEMQRSIEQRVALEADLRGSIERNELHLLLQPQVNRNGMIIGAEVLLRWQHPERGLVSPAQFIPLAEETGFIVFLGDWVLERSVEILQKWQNDPVFAKFQLAVNVSSRQFMEYNFVEKIKNQIKGTGINPSLLKLELTESLILDRVDEAVQTMAALRRIGVEFSMDDFGTGYSSLSYLKNLPLSQLKIDQSFLVDIPNNHSDAAIVRTILSIGRTLGLEVIAEGVENREQLKFLVTSGCPVFQGYYFGKPVTINEFEQHVHEKLRELESSTISVG